MDREKLIKETSIRAVKDTLKLRNFMWSDTRKYITYIELLNVLGFEEPLSLEEAKKILSSLSNDSRIIKSIK